MSRVSACGRVCVCVCVCAWRDRAVVRRESARAVARARGGGVRGDRWDDAIGCFLGFPRVRDVARLTVCVRVCVRA